MTKKTPEGLLLCTTVTSAIAWLTILVLYIFGVLSDSQVEISGCLIVLYGALMSAVILVKINKARKDLERRWERLLRMSPSKFGNRRQP